MRYVATVLAVLWLSTSVYAQRGPTIFSDDFTSGNLDQWTLWSTLGPAGYDLTDDGLVLTPIGTDGFAAAGLFWNTDVADVSVRAQLRLTNLGDSVFLWSRGSGDVPLSASSSYNTGVLNRSVGHSTTPPPGDLLIAQDLPDARNEQWNVDLSDVFDFAHPPLNLNEDFMLQLDTVDTMVRQTTGRGTSVLVPGVRLDMWVWRPGEPMPNEPFFTAFDTRDIYLSGTVGIWVGGPANVPVATVRSFDVAIVPEPTTAVLFITAIGLGAAQARWRRSRT